jgi:hypothetical protein
MEISEGFCRHTVNNTPCPKETVLSGSCSGFSKKLGVKVPLKHISEWNKLTDSKRAEIKTALAIYNTQVASHSSIKN